MVFQKLLTMAEQKASARVRERRVKLAQEVSDQLPHGVTAEASDEGVIFSGRGVLRRLTLDPALRWLTAGLR